MDPFDETVLYHTTGFLRRSIGQYCITAPASSLTYTPSSKRSLGCWPLARPWSLPLIQGRLRNGNFEYIVSRYTALGSYPVILDLCVIATHIVEPLRLSQSPAPACITLVLQSSTPKDLRISSTNDLTNTNLTTLLKRINITSYQFSPCGRSANRRSYPHYRCLDIPSQV